METDATREGTRTILSDRGPHGALPVSPVECTVRRQLSLDLVDKYNRAQRRETGVS